MECGRSTLSGNGAAARMRPLGRVWPSGRVRRAGVRSAGGPACAPLGSCLRPLLRDLVEYTCTYTSRLGLASRVACSVPSGRARRETKSKSANRASSFTTWVTHRAGYCFLALWRCPPAWLRRAARRRRHPSKPSGHLACKSGTHGGAYLDSAMTTMRLALLAWRQTLHMCAPR